MSEYKITNSYPSNSNIKELNNNHKTTLVVNIERPMNKLQMLTYQFLTIIKHLAICTVILVLINNIPEF